MHIAEGLLTTSPLGMVELAAGWGISGIATAVAIRRLDDRSIPTVALLSATFFVVSMVHIPIGAGSAHLVLSGFMGLLLGWAAFPAIGIALLLQFLFFSYGGLTTLGVNTVVMATPGVICYYFFGSRVRRGNRATVFLNASLAGAFSIAGAMVLYYLLLVLAQADLKYLAALVTIFHLPLLFLEAIFTGMIVTFLYRVRPEVLSPVRMGAAFGEREIQV